MTSEKYTPYNEFVDALLNIPALILFSILVAFFILMIRIYFDTEKELKEKDRFLSALDKLYTIMVSLVTLDETAQKLTDALAFEFGFKAGVLSLIDRKTNILKRTAVSHTKAGLIGLKMLPVPYDQIGINLDDRKNLLIKAIRERKYQITNDMYDLFVPVLDRAFVKNLQNLMEIKTSIVYPIFSSNQEITGTMIFSIGEKDKNPSTFQKEAITRVIQVVGLVIDRIYLYEQLANTSKSLAFANQKLKELDQLKDDFVSVASHELRTPMTAIRSYVWMALHKSDVPLSQKLERYLYRTLLSTERLINLVSDMLNVSRIESGVIEITPKPFNIVELVKDVMEEVKVKADEKRLQLLVLEHALPKVFADADKVHEVLLNLIGNALKFTYPGGAITVDFFTDGKMVEVSIKDNGLGISKDDLSKLFHKFSRLDNSYTAVSTSGGTGLGLYISKSLVELMHGSIRVTSEGIDKGSTFTFSLPAANQETLKHADQFTVKAKGEVKGLEPVAI